MSPISFIEFIFELVMELSKKIYYRLPVFAHNVSLSAVGFYINRGRYNKHFYDEFEAFRLTESLSRIAVQNFLEEKYDKLLFKVKANERSLARFNFYKSSANCSD